MREKASWVGDGCLMMTKSRLPSPRSSHSSWEQRRGLQRPGIQMLQFCQHQARSLSPAVLPQSLLFCPLFSSPPPTLPFLLFPYLSLSFSCFLWHLWTFTLPLFKTFKRSKVFVLPCNALPVHLILARNCLIRMCIPKADVLSPRFML